MPDLLTQAIDGRAALLMLAILALALYGLRATPRAKRRPAPPVVMNQAKPCHTTGCAYPGLFAVTVNTEARRVCGGCYAEGNVRGWWAA